MSRTDRDMVLGVFFNYTGHHVASWLHPEACADAGVNWAHFKQISQSAERGKFHFIFFADWLAVRLASEEALSRSSQYTAHFEPLTLLGAIAAVTERIGLICTATTSYNEPYHVARKFASLDFISGGRAGWNVVTSANPAEAWNFGKEKHYVREDRYDRAKEFVEVVKGLWDSWDDDAFVRDRETGVYFDPGKVHTLDHKGKHFTVRGPLNVPRTPQGHPVIVQAGASEFGKDFAAQTAEIVFVAPPDMKAAKGFYTDLKSRMSQYGRSPEDLKIMPGLNVIVGETDAEADAKYDFLQSRIHPQVGKEILSTILGGVDLSPYGIDDPLPDLPDSDEAQGGTRKFVVEMAKRENLTIKDLYLRLAGARGKRTIKGSVKRVADEMEEWFVEGACDGFITQPAYLPGSMDDFIELVIPELQRRGLFHKDYRGASLRDNLGFKRPASRWQDKQHK
jgi:FMN-dependent oxidoreductase (nitrilotriacetate monooxygenase family)